LAQGMRQAAAALRAAASALCSTDAMSTKAAPAPTDAVPVPFAERVAGALWGLHIGDALAMPAHWYYGGRQQVEQHYGRITGYVKPKEMLSGSIMALSNTGGAGRGGFDGDIIGTVIAHGKKPYWARARSHHYHCTLDKGENTVDADLVRVCYRSITEGGGRFSPDVLRQRYVDFMTTPDTYNDCYMSTTHRMFFSNKVRGLPLDKCPDNDNHNVDTVDGITMLIPVALATAHLPAGQAHEQVSDCVSVTRRSQACQQYGCLLTDMFRSIMAGRPLAEVMESTAGRSIRNVLQRPDPVVA